MRAILLLREPALDVRVAGLVLTPAAGPLAPETVAPAVRCAWYWREALVEIAHHQASLAVALEAPPADPLDHALALTRASAALATELGAIAVFWEPTALVHETATFAEQSEDASREDPPIFLWVAFEGSEKDDGTRSLLTRGVRALGGVLEIEVDGSRRDGEHVFECVADAALFSVTSRAEVGDGDVIEVTRGEVRVRIMPSLRGDGTKAWRLRVA
jgi:hypothetical protein